MTVSLITLTNGTEVIGQILKVDEKILLEDPMQVNYRTIQTSTSSVPSISFTRYCPLSMENIFQFDMKHVLHITPVKKAIEKYYEQSVEYHKAFADKYIDEEFINAVQTKEDVQSEIFKKFLEKVKIDGYAQ